MAASTLRVSPINYSPPLLDVAYRATGFFYIVADDLMKALPETTRELPELRNLIALLNLIRHAQDAPPRATLENAIIGNANDLGARYLLGAVKITQDDYTGATEQLLEIVQRDDGSRRREALNGLLAIFALLGEDNAHVQYFRAQLREAMN